MALSEGSPLARKFELPAPVHCVRLGNRVPMLALGSTLLQGPGDRTVSSTLPVLTGTAATVASNPPVAAAETFSVGPFSSPPLSRR
jgi:hypothetical protein